MSNKKFLILEGGNNEEHDVSLVTSREIQKILNQNKLKFKTLRVNPKNFHKKIINYKNFICINALHGPFGEDGQTQKICMFITHICISIICTFASCFLN